MVWTVTNATSVFVLRQNPRRNVKPTMVKNNGIRIVVKNNTPECVLISPKDYQALLEQYEDALLMVEANNRLSDNVKYISHKDILRDLNINEQALENIDIELD